MLHLYIQNIACLVWSLVQCSCIYWLTARCRVLLEQLTGLQPVKKFPTFHGTRRFITALTTVRHLSLSWASPSSPYTHIPQIHHNIIHPSTPRTPQWSLSLRFPHQDPIHHSPHRSIIILSTHLRLGLPNGLFPSGFPTKTLYTPSPHRSIVILSTHLA